MTLRYLGACIVTLSVFAGGLFSGAVVANDAILDKPDPYEGLYSFSLNLHRIQNDYIDVIDTPELMHHAVQGMVNNLDEYSHYFPPEEYTQIRKRTDRWSVGAGLQVSDNKVITNIVPHGPASIAGLMVGDKIQRIDGQSVDKWSVGNIRYTLEQELGSRVDVDVSRVNDMISTTIVLDEVESILYSIQPIQPGFVYIQLERFGGDLVQSLQHDIQTLQKQEDAPLKGIILDMRGNPGGNVLEGVRLADWFMDSGQITALSYRDPSANQVHSATSQSSDLLECRLTILINEDTASAAELAAGALQDAGRATLYGVPSHGKGSVQKMYTSETEALKLTVGSFTAGRQTVSKPHPIQPDVLVELNHQNPKELIRSKLQQQGLSSEALKEIEQHLDLLTHTPLPPSIPWHQDFQRRTQMDPQLNAAWQGLIQ